MVHPEQLEQLFLGQTNHKILLHFPSVLGVSGLMVDLCRRRQMQCLEAAVPLVEGASAGHALALSRMGFRPCTGSLVHLRDCNRSQEGQRWRPGCNFD